MPQIKNTFLKSKMNKDLDARLIPNGEYRDGQNISVSSSEGASVGALENIRGNKLLTSFGLTDFNLEIIGKHVDTENNRIFFFLTNFTDTSIDQLSNLALETASASENNYTFQRNSGANYICYCQIPSSSSTIDINSSSIVFDVLVSGSFLNFSKTHPILGTNIVEDLLFFTDDRNQPRKINVKTAIANPLTYYTSEDHISVAKYAPFESISFLKNTTGTVESTLKNESDEWLSAFFGAPGQILSTSGAADTLIFDETTSGVTTYTDVVRHLGSGTPSSPIRVTSSSDPDASHAYVQNIDAVSTPAKVFLKSNKSGTAVPIVDIQTTLGWSNGHFLFQIENPDYNLNFKGDKDLLTNKFVRFSYRFKYDDSEYSLLAPFSQHAFVPKQYGYFIQGDDDKAKESSIVEFMENQITTAGLVINLPYKLNELKSKLKIDEIQLVYKASDEENVKVVSSVKVNSPSLQSIPSTLSITEAGSGYTTGSYSNVALTGGGGTGLKVDIVVNGAGRVTSVTIVNSGENYKIGDLFSIQALGAPPSGSGAIVTVNSFSNKFIYNYTSQKPIKVLPEKEIVRVSDIVPLRAKTQESVGNRIVYGNFLQNNETPKSLEYTLSVVDKGTISTDYKKEFLNHNLKQNRSYQVGVVLQDRYGRSSNVIINDEVYSNDSLTSTLFNPYTSGGTNPLEWPGKSLSILFSQEIPKERTQTYNGVWSDKNPTGWYSYKVVVKQLEQDYYNVYVPGITSGNIIYTKNDVELTFQETGNVASVALFNDNINKIPRDLKEVGPSDNVYASSTVLYNVVKQTHASTPGVPDINEQNNNISRVEITSISPFRELGDWTDKKNIDLHYLNAIDSSNTQYPVGTYIYPGGNTNEGSVDPYYLNVNKNPLICTLSTKKRLGFSKANQENTSWKFAKDLCVFETEPFESSIEIYYETSTSGLISDLNNSIVTSPGDYATKAPVGISNMVATGWLENLQVNDNITNSFQIINSNGSFVQDPTTQIIINNVVDSSGATVSNYPFYLKQIQAPSAPSTPATYALALGSRIPYVSNSNNIHNYEITFDLVVDGYPVGQASASIELTNRKPVIYGNDTILGGWRSNSYLMLAKTNNPFTVGTFPLDTVIVPRDTNDSYKGLVRAKFVDNGFMNNFFLESAGFYPICDLMFSSNGFEDVTTFNASTDQQIAQTSFTRCEGMQYRIKSATRYDILFDNLSPLTGEPEGRYKQFHTYSGNNVGVDKKHNFELVTATPLASSNSFPNSIQLRFIIPGGGKISNSDLPSQGLYIDNYRGAWLYYIEIEAFDASGATGHEVSDPYGLQFIVTK